jgi:hypothetical protein
MMALVVAVWIRGGAAIFIVVDRGLEELAELIAVE